MCVSALVVFNSFGILAAWTRIQLAQFLCNPNPSNVIIDFFCIEASIYGLYSILAVSTWQFSWCVVFYVFSLNKAWLWIDSMKHYGFWVQISVFIWKCCIKIIVQNLMKTKWHLQTHTMLLCIKLYSCEPISNGERRTMNPNWFYILAHYLNLLNLCCLCICRANNINWEEIWVTEYMDAAFV